MTIQNSIERQQQRDQVQGIRTIRPMAGRKVEASIQELLRWAFVSERAKLEFDDIESTMGPVVGTDAIYQLMEYKRLGIRPDGGGRTEPHPDADSVASAVAALRHAYGGPQMALTVYDLSCSGLVPDWMPDARMICSPVEWRNSKHGLHAKTERVGVVTYQQRGRSVTKEVRHCPVRFINSTVDIARARRWYQDWWRALFELRETFRLYGGLSAFTVTTAMPSRTPWKKTC